MYKHIFKSMVIIVVILLSSCSNERLQTNESDLSPAEFSKKIKQMPSSPLIDVRTPEEFSKGHLGNAKNINWEGYDFENQIAQFALSVPVFVYCLSGGRSSSAANKMRSLGFREVYELKGGISQWRSDGFPVEDK
jgi:thioredoxin 1